MSCNCAQFAAKLNTILKEVRGMNRRISALEKENALQAEQISDLQEENARLKRQIETNARRITIQANRITRLDRRVDEVEGRISALEQRLGIEISNLSQSFVNDMNQRDALLRALITGLIKGLEVIVQGIGWLAQKAWELVQGLPEQIEKTNREIERVIKERERREKEIMDSVRRQIDRVLREIQTRNCPGPTIVKVPVPAPYPVEKVVRVREPFPVPQPYPVEKPVIVPGPAPAPVKIPVPTPFVVPKPVPTPVKVPVPTPVPVQVPTPYPVKVPTPVPVQVPTPYPVDRPVPYPVTNTTTITKIREVPVPKPFPVTNTVTKIVPQIVTITPDCPDPCPPCPEIPEQPEIEFPILNGAWADPGCGLDAPGKTYQYGGVGFFGLANAVEKVGEQLTDLKLALCPWLKEPSHDFQIVDCFAAQDAAVCGDEYEPPRIEIKQLKGMDYFEKLNTEIFNYLKEIKADFCKIEANADWNVHAFDEVSHLVSGIYLTFRVMNVEDPNFPRRRSNTTFYSYELPRARTDITLQELKCIEWNRGPNYFWVHPQGIKSTNKLISGYFENERKAKCDLQRIYNLTQFAAQGIPPQFGFSKRSSPSVSPSVGKFKIVQAALFDADTGECLNRWHSRDFAPCPNDPPCPDCPPDNNPLCS